jgi:3-oxoacyl-[acyl-carrier protein] reductase
MKEFARNKIRCVCIAPGFILTDMVASMNQAALQKLAAQVPSGRGGQPSEVGALAVSMFENDFLNGVIYKIHGGFDL